jgi:hypothetical protein
MQLYNNVHIYTTGRQHHCKDPKNILKNTTAPTIAFVIPSTLFVYDIPIDKRVMKGTAKLAYRFILVDISL